MGKIQAIIGSEFPKYVGELIDSAKQSIDIIVFDWRWYANMPGSAAQQFNHRITSAPRRGVRVRVIGNQADTLKILESLGVKTKILQTKRLVHAKLMIIDGTHIVLGSHNYTHSAFMQNFELSSHVEDEEYAQRFITYFSHLWQ